MKRQFIPDDEIILNGENDTNLAIHLRNMLEKEVC